MPMPASTHISMRSSRVRPGAADCFLALCDPVADVKCRHEIAEQSGCPWQSRILRRTDRAVTGPRRHKGPVTANSAGAVNSRMTRNVNHRTLTSVALPSSASAPPSPILGLIGEIHPVEDCFKDLFSVESSADSAAYLPGVSPRSRLRISSRAPAICRHTVAKAGRRDITASTRPIIAPNNRHGSHQRSDHVAILSRGRGATSDNPRSRS